MYIELHNPAPITVNVNEIEYVTPVWQDELHSVISECALEILEAISE